MSADPGDQNGFPMPSVVRASDHDGQSEVQRRATPLHAVDVSEIDDQTVRRAPVPAEPPITSVPATPHAPAPAPVQQVPAPMPPPPSLPHVPQPVVAPPTPLPPPPPVAQAAPTAHPHRPEPAATQPSEPHAADLFTQIERGRHRVERPETGFRRFLYEVTRGRVNLGPDEAQRHREGLINQIRQPLPGGIYNVMVWSQKGGVGKTTITTSLGCTTAKYRADAILALDTNADGGSLAVRVPKTTDRTILDLRDRLEQGHLAPADFDMYVNKDPHTRLDSLVMPPGKKPERPLTETDYVAIANALRSYYPYKIIYTDCGTDLSSRVMEGVLAVTDLLVVVTSTLMDEAVVTSGGLEALTREGHGDLVRNAVTVIVDKTPKDPDAETQREIESDAREIREYFRHTTRRIIETPYDSRIRRGGVLDPDTISEESRLQHLEITADVIQSLAQAR